MSEPHDRIIRASEIGQYVYCAYAWWLGSVRGIRSSHRREMAVGKVAHWRHGRQARAAALLTRLAWALLALALLVGTLWMRQLWVG